MPKADLSGMPSTISKAVTDRLRAEIREGVLPPGSRLLQAQIAAEYGVSTTPVREAVAALEREGLVQTTAHRGAFVFKPSVAELREIYEIRRLLEGLATELGASNLTDEELDELSSLLDRMTAANKKKDWKRSSELNDEFHTIIYEATDSARLLKMIAELRDSSRAYIGLFPKFFDRVAGTESEHREIYEACLARKPKQAAKAMANHLQHTVELVSAGLEEDEKTS